MQFGGADYRQQSAQPAYGLPFANTAPRVTDFTPEQRDAWRRYIAQGDASDLKASLSVNVESGGGYWVHAQLSSRINSLLFETSPIRRLARVETITEGDAWEETLTSSLGDAAWVGETQARAETNSPEIKKVRVAVAEIYAQPKSTQKLLDSSSMSVERWLSDSLSKLFGIRESAAFVSGDGNAKPRGFLTYTLSTGDDDTREFDQVEYISTGASGAFLSTNPWTGMDTLENAVTALKSEYRPSAVWLMNRRTMGVIRKLRNADGDSLWTASNQAGQPALLLGFPVIEATDLPDIAANSLSVAFGNFREAYCVVDHVAMRILRDPFTQKGWVLFYATKRVGGGLVKCEALKLIRFSTA
jgi:HK97 family phage major capsid protein